MDWETFMDREPQAALEWMAVVATINDEAGDHLTPTYVPEDYDYYVARDDVGRRSHLAILRNGVGHWGRDPDRARWMFWSDHRDWDGFLAHFPVAPYV